MNQDNIEKEREEEKLKMIQEEFEKGIAYVKQFDPSVTFYGSARVHEESEDYKKVQNLAYRISKELGYTIMSGGGPGMMEASNRGAHDAGGKSVGLTIKLPNEQYTNPYVTNEIPFNFFFTRQTAMSFSTEVCIFCPGGFGTLNELFEVLTLEQTDKIGRIPLVLFGTEFWNPIEKVIENILVKKYETISATDTKLYIITDDEDEILEIVKNSKRRKGEDALN